MAERAVGIGFTIQDDGKYLVGGFFEPDSTPGITGPTDIALWRFNPDGTPDLTFGTGGRVVTSLGGDLEMVRAVAVQADGTIIAGGFSGSDTDTSFVLLRYLADGTLDTSFGTQGAVITDIGGGLDEPNGLTLLADGRILLEGTSKSSDNDFCVVRYLADGTLDTAWSGDGVALTPVGPSDDYGYPATLQPDGKLVMTGSSHDPNSEMSLVRFNTDGSLDATFGGGDGKVFFGLPGYNQGESVALQADGKIVVAGSSTVENTDFYGNVDFAVWRFNPDGSLDTSFGGDGFVTTDIAIDDQAHAVVVQPDGKIVAAGEAIQSPGPAWIERDCALVRYNPDGSLDTSFGDGGTLVISLNPGADEIYALKLRDDGSIAALADYQDGRNFYSALVIIGTDGDDVLVGRSGDDTILGFAGQDTLNGRGGDDSMVGGTDDDLYFVNSRGDLVVEKTNEGIDAVNSTVTYTLGNDVEDLTLAGTRAINGNGNTEDNEIEGNAANNFISGGDGADTLEGFDGDDTVNGGDGNDLIVGGSGKGDDRYTGGAGIDTLRYSSARNPVTLDAGAGTASGLDTGNDTFSGFEHFLGGGGADSFTGDGAGNLLYGGGGNDTLKGMGGADTLQGGAGADRLTGGAGNDRFVFAEAPVGKGDTITDFVHASDKIALDDVVFAALRNLGPLTHGEFGVYVTYDSGTGHLFYDADGAGAGLSVLVATLAGAPTLTASDITVI